MDSYDVIFFTPPGSYMTLSLVGMLVWFVDPLGYAGGSVTTIRVTIAGQAKGQNPDKEAAQKRMSNSSNSRRGAIPTAEEAEETPQVREGRTRLCCHSEGNWSRGRKPQNHMTWPWRLGLGHRVDTPTPEKHIQFRSPKQIAGLIK